MSKIRITIDVDEDRRTFTVVEGDDVRTFILREISVHRSAVESYGEAIEDYGGPVTLKPGLDYIWTLKGTKI